MGNLGASWAHLGRALGASWNARRRLGAILERLGAILERLGWIWEGFGGVLEAFWEHFWKIVEQVFGTCCGGIRRVWNSFRGSKTCKNPIRHLGEPIKTYIKRSVF